MANESEWTKLTSFGSALEADMAVSRLEAVGIPAISRGNDIVGIFGPGFQGVTARGVDVLVPANAIEDAREELELDDR
ncbi:MAG TPA: DUF2007 domain-containing protein [Gemmatimonadaceae bacterium]|jgi:hypothetical protein|nr:DUF2007 domain-containing protein [Gemmatimonadaceae bacterium]